MLFNVALSVLGVLVAFPMKRRFINEEQQPFPEGAACGVVLDALYSTDSGAGMYKAKVLAKAAALAGGIGLLSGGGQTWIVADWEGVKNFSDATTNSFQVWIGVATNTDSEDISFTYGSTGSGDSGFLTVGAENFNGSQGANFYVDGTGTLPTGTTELVVTTTPGDPGGSHTVDFTALANKKGLFDSCAHATTNLVFGTVAGCVSGEVLP